MTELTEIKLELRDISKSFVGVRALDHVSFLLRRGTTHVLCGENGAGKSTLMKIINGLYKPDGGQVFIDGQEVSIHNPFDARSHGIAMIYQELSYVPDLTLAENIFLGRWPTNRFGIIDWKQVNDQTAQLLKREGLSYSPDVKLRSLSVSDIQMIEILKAVSYGAEIIIMDEPTSAITNKEVDRLFEKIRVLNANGVSVIYISHKLDEIFCIADDVTILRDGQLIETRKCAEFDENTIVELMVGRTIENQYCKENIEIGDDLLCVEHLSSDMMFDDISFNVRKGEIVGFAGLMGAGRTEVMRAIFGLDKYDSGNILMGNDCIRSLRDAIGHGMIMLSEDRRRYGIVPMMSVSGNVALASLDKFITRGRWKRREEQTEVQAMCTKMRVKTPSLDTKVMSLSGGNQQKVILAKWMVRDPSVLILDEPTRGIDVGSKNEIYHLMMQLAQSGKGIVMVSSELPELVGMCDRVYIMHEGRITGMLNRNEISQDAIMKHAIKAAG